MRKKRRRTRKTASRAKPSQSKPARRSARTVKKPVSREQPQRPSPFTLSELQAIERLSSLASVCLDMEGKVVSWNKAAESLFGWTAVEVLGRELSFVPSDQAQESEALWNRAMQGEEFHGLPLRRLRKDGTLVDVELWTTLLRDQDGAVVGALGLMADVTERKQAEDRLRQSEEQYRGLVDTMQEGVGVQDKHGLITYVNKRLCEMVGYEREELIGKPAAFLFDEENQKILREQMERRRKGERQSFEIAWRRKDGGKVDTIIAPNPRFDTKGNFVESTAVITDITERKRAEAFLSGEKDALALIAHEQPLPFVLDRICRLLEEQCPGMLCSVLLLEGQRLRHGAAPTLPEGYSRSVDGLVIGPCAGSCGTAAFRKEPVFVADIATDPLWKDCRELGLRHGLRACWSIPILSSSGTVLGTFAMYHREPKNPTDREKELVKIVVHLAGVAIGRERAAEALRKSEEQLRQAQKMEAIGRLAGGIAHDFNNLLTIILGQSELMLKRLDRQSPMQEAIEEIKKAGERAASLTNQLLAFSRKQVLQHKTLALNGLVANMEALLRRLIGEHITLTTVLEPALGHVRADPGQLEQVLLNLAVNARDAMPLGGTLTLATANVDLSSADAGPVELSPGPYVSLTVRDEGCGMDPAIQARIFEPFFTTKEQGKGTGLGLSMVYGIVKQSGGAIAVQSEPARGATFILYLPQVTAEPEPSRDERPTRPVEGSTETILVVEDEDAVRGLVVSVLTAAGYRVLTAQDGKEALRLSQAQAGRIDLLLTDVVMPGLHGQDLAQQLQAQRPHLQVLYMSGYTDDVALIQGLPDSSQPFLQKPFSPLDLARKVREVLKG